MIIQKHVEFHGNGTIAEFTEYNVIELFKIKVKITDKTGNVFN